MATPPLVFVTSPQRQRPSGELIIDEILERRLYCSKWFSVLYDGSSRSSKTQFELATGDALSNASSQEMSAPTGLETATASPRVVQPPEPILTSSSSPAHAETSTGPKRKGFLASRASPVARRGKGADTTAAPGAAGGATEALPLPDRREKSRLARVVKVKASPEHESSIFRTWQPPSAYNLHLCCWLLCSL